MAEILIRNMEMPKDRKIVVIESDGNVWEQIADTSYFCTGKAVELPPHGDLIDRSKLVIHGWIYDDGELQEHADYYDVTEVQNAPTILEASDGYTN